MAPLPSPALKWRKKPIVVKAVRWDGNNFCSLDEPWRSLIAPRYSGAVYQAGPNLCVETLAGKVIASPGDWIIRGAKDELSSCKPDIFEATYEPESSRSPDPLRREMEEALKASRLDELWQMIGRLGWNDTISGADIAALRQLIADLRALTKSTEQ